MNLRMVLLVVAALIVAGVTAFLARTYLMQSLPDQQGAAVQTTHVMVAAKPLGMGHLLLESDLRWQEWPAEGINPNYIQQKGSETIQGQVGKVVRYGLTPGEPLTLQRMIAPGERGFLAAVLKPGMRAFTIPVNRTSGLAGFVFPGDRVDVILRHRIRDGSGAERDVSETILQNVRVIGVDTRSSDTNQKPALGKSVTLEVTPKIAEKLAMVGQLGTMTLALRSLSPAEAAGKEPISPDDLEPVGNPATYTLETEVSRLVPPWQPRLKTITVARGTSVRIIGYDPNKSNAQVMVDVGGATTSLIPAIPTGDDQ
ncbi:MAG TPA: Flp pilus assembly protein CpaB [Sphingomonadales bacterium]|nr:Flp pilus assembly protein CpaB [Sphingomonadales bacterium]